MCKCAADCPTPGNNARCTITTTYLVALHAVLGKLGLMASHTVEVLPFREEASGPNDLLAVAAGEAVFMPDGALVLHVLVSCRGKQSNSHRQALQGAASAQLPSPSPEAKGCRPCSQWPPSTYPHVLLAVMPTEGSVTGGDEAPEPPLPHLHPCNN